MHDIEWGMADGHGAKAMVRHLEVIRRVTRIRYGETMDTTQSWEDEVNSLSQPSLTQGSLTEPDSSTQGIICNPQTSDAIKNSDVLSLRSSPAPSPTTGKTPD